jgi:hypothetical protein
MDSEIRIRMTRLVWFAWVIAMIAAFIFLSGSALSYGTLIPIVIMMTVGAVISTGFFWNWGFWQSNADAATGKAKRTGEALIDQLDDAEIEALRQRLAGSPGRPLGTLIGEDGELADTADR